MTRGTLTIVSLQAFIINKPPSRYFASKINTFVRFYLGNRVCSTQFTNQKGINPFWEDVISIKKKSSDILKIELIDHHTLFADELVGKGEISLKGIQMSHSMNRHEIWLRKDGQVSAKIAFEILFEKQIQQIPNTIKQDSPQAVKKVVSESQESPEKSKSLKDPSPFKSPPKQSEKQQKPETPLKQSPETMQKAIKKRIMKIVECQYEEKSKHIEPEMQSPMVYDYIAQGNFPDLDFSKANDFLNISIKEMKVIRQKKLEDNPLLLSDVVSLRDLLVHQQILFDQPENQLPQPPEQKREGMVWDKAALIQISTSLELEQTKNEPTF